jgi:hypothetical protein
LAEVRALGCAKLRLDLAIPRRLTGLPGESGKLARELFDHIIDPFEVRFGALELQFRLVPPLVEARDPRRFLQNPTPVLGLGVDQFGNLSLAHQRGRLRTG